MTLAGSATLGTRSVSATESNGQGILADGLGEGGNRWAFARGLLSGFIPAGPPDDTVTLADNARNEFRSYKDHWLDYGNWLVDEAGVTPIGSATVAVTFDITWTRWLSTDDPVETVIDVEYDDEADEFSDLDWIDQPADDPDYQLEIRNKAAERASEELNEFRRSFIDPDEGHSIPDDEYLSELAGRYSSNFRYGEDSRSVLEVLLGKAP